MHFSLKASLMWRWWILTISSGHIHGNYFCWGFTASFIACIWTQNSSSVLTARCCGTLNTVEPLFTVIARSPVVSSSAAIFSSIIDGFLKYKNKEKPKTGPRPGPRLYYYVNIALKPSPRDVKSEPDFNFFFFFYCVVTQALLNMYRVKYNWSLINNALQYCVTAKSNPLR